MQNLLQLVIERAGDQTQYPHIANILLLEFPLKSMIISSIHIMLRSRKNWNYNLLWYKSPSSVVDLCSVIMRGCKIAFLNICNKSYFDDEP